MANTFTKKGRDTVIQRFRYYVSASTTNHYHENAGDFTDSMARWDDSTPDPAVSGFSNRDSPALNTVPFDCRLKGFQSISTTFSTGGSWGIYLWYGPPDYDSTNAIPSTLACSASSVQDTRFVYEDVSNTCDIALSQGDTWIFTVKKGVPSTVILSGSVTAYMERT